MCPVVTGLWLALVRADSSRIRRLGCGNQPDARRIRRRRHHRRRRRTAVNDSFTVAKNSGIALDAGQRRRLHQPVTVTLESGPSGGTASAGSPKQALIRINYAPSAGFTGTIPWFTGRGRSLQPHGDGHDRRTSTQAVNDMAVARNGMPAVIDVLSNDMGFTDPLSVAITSPPTVSRSSPAHPAVPRTCHRLYAGRGLHGPDSLSYEVSDGINSGTATVSSRSSSTRPSTLAVAAQLVLHQHPGGRQRLRFPEPGHRQHRAGA